ncbi:MAG: hypothetical protein AB9903_20115 [Vulcanimicrobiota bacterium]
MKVHLRFKGKSESLDGDRFGITGGTSDQTIRSLLSEIYSLPSESLRDMVIDRNPDGVVVRPPAVFG